MGTRLVGRDADVRSGMRALDTARFVALTGPTGVGKSRVMAELVERHRSVGVPAYAVIASEATRTVPLSPLVGLLESDPPRDITLLTAAIVAGVRSRAPASGRQLVVVDDAHHLDEGSVAALAAILAGSSATVMVTIRDDGPRTPALDDLLRQDHSARVTLAALSREDTRSLIEDSLGVAEDELHDRVWDLTRGNPLMVQELLASASEALSLAPDGRWRLTGDVGHRRLAGLARDRLRGLGEQRAAAMELIALGAPLPPAVLTAAAPGPILDDLLALGLVEVVPHGPGSAVRPLHPLHGDVLREAIGPERLRAAYDELVRAALVAEADLDPLRLALWQRRSGRVHDIDVAVRGVRAALSRYDGRLAEDLLDQVAEHLSDPQEALLRASALVQQVRPAEAEKRLATIDPRDTDPRTATGLATTRAFNLAFGLSSPDRADAVLQAAQETLSDDAARLHLDTERGVIAGIAGNFDRAAAAAQRVLAEPAAPPVATTSAYVTLTLAAGMRGDCERLEDLTRSGRDAAFATSDDLPLALDQIEVMTATGRLLAGDVRGVTDLADHVLADPSRRLTHWLWQTYLAIAHCADGDLTAGRRAAEAAREQFALARLLDLGGCILGIEAVVRGHAGDTAGLAHLEQVRRTRDDPRNVVWLDRGRAWLQAAAGNLDQARQISLDCGRHALAHDHRSYAILALHDAVRMGSGRVSDEAATALAEAAAHTRGAVLAETMADHAVAVTRSDPVGLLTAARDFGRLGASLLAAEAAAQAAALRSDRDEETAALRATVLSLAWERDCREARTPALTARPDAPLSDRVLEVALRAAGGESSADIADALHLSVRTVDNHLGTAYRVLEVPGRAGLRELLAPELLVG